METRCHGDPLLWRPLTGPASPPQAPMKAQIPPSQHPELHGKAPFPLTGGNRALYFFFLLGIATDQAPGPGPAPLGLCRPLPHRSRPR